MVDALTALQRRLLNKYDPAMSKVDLAALLERALESGGAIYGEAEDVIYVNPAAADNGDGSPANPFNNLVDANAAARLWDTIIVQGPIDFQWPGDPYASAPSSATQIDDFVLKSGTNYHFFGSFFISGRCRWDEGPWAGIWGTRVDGHGSYYSINAGQLSGTDAWLELANTEKFAVIFENLNMFFDGFELLHIDDIINVESGAICGLQFDNCKINIEDATTFMVSESVSSAVTVNGGLIEGQRRTIFDCTDGQINLNDNARIINTGVFKETIEIQGSAVLTVKGATVENKGTPPAVYMDGPNTTCKVDASSLIKTQGTNALTRDNPSADIYTAPVFSGNLDIGIGPKISLGEGATYDYVAGDPVALGLFGTSGQLATDTTSGPGFNSYICIGNNNWTILP